MYHLSELMPKITADPIVKIMVETPPILVSSQLLGKIKIQKGERGTIPNFEIKTDQAKVITH